MVCKDAESISARGFHECSRCRIVRTTAVSFSRQNDVAWFTREQNSVLGKSRILVVVLVSESKGL